VSDFAPRNNLDHAQLLALWAWTELEFLKRLEGSAIRRIGHARWLRNIATALGNALASLADDTHADTINNRVQQQIRAALSQHQNHPHPAVREHIAWALAQ
jgi:epoxyqueuosine reductase